MRNILIAAAAALYIFTGCARYDIDEVLLSKTEVSMSLKGKDIYIYDPNLAQFGFRPERNEYRIVNDDLSGWFTVICNVKPSIEGERIKADVEWMTKTEIGKTAGAEFVVRKISDDGIIWLWCDDEKIGVVLKDI